MAQNDWGDRPDATQMRQNYDTVIGLARAGGFRTPETGWKAEQVIGHVLEVTELLSTVGAGVRRGESPDCGHPDVVDDELLARRADELGGLNGLADRLESAAAELLGYAESLTDAEAATDVQFIVYHAGNKIADEPRAYGRILAGHSSFHLPLHIDQLRALAPEAQAGNTQPGKVSSGVDHR
jgi:hypothetical protein